MDIWIILKALDENTHLKSKTTVNCSLYNHIKHCQVYLELKMDSESKSPHKYKYFQWTEIEVSTCPCKEEETNSSSANRLETVFESGTQNTEQAYIVFQDTPIRSHLTGTMCLSASAPETPAAAPSEILISFHHLQRKEFPNISSDARHSVPTSIRNRSL